MIPYIFAPFSSTFAKLFNHFPMFLVLWARDGLWTSTDETDATHYWFCFSRNVPTPKTAAEFTDTPYYQLLIWKLQISYAWVKNA